MEKKISLGVPTIIFKNILKKKIISYFDFWETFFFAKKGILGWCKKVISFISWITFLSDELQKNHNTVEKVFLQNFNIQKILSHFIH